MRKHIVITRLFEFGGSNSHLTILLKYFGKENAVIIVEGQNEAAFLKNIRGAGKVDVRVMPGLHRYAHLTYPSPLSNIKELFYILRSIFSIFLLSLKHGFADVTVSVVEPEKYLYLLCLPFLRVSYILHSTPGEKYTIFTTNICKWALGKRKRIITVSKSNKSLIVERWAVPPKKQDFVEVIYNCILEPEFSLNTQKSDRQYIVTLGHVVAYKNPALWLEVAKNVTFAHNDIYFIWLGNGPLLNDFQTATRELKNISFPGAVTKPEAYLENAIIYYQPSLQETHGIAVVEAMSHHLPCVVSATGGLTETIFHEYNGLLVAPEAARDHAAALISLIENPQLRKVYGANGYKTYRDAFSFDTFKAKMDAIYTN